MWKTRMGRARAQSWSKRLGESTSPSFSMFRLWSRFRRVHRSVLTR